jgi:hypothetical protein
MALVAGSPGLSAPAQSAGEGTNEPTPIALSKPRATYSNFCRITTTPEELILDFGLNTKPAGTPEIEINDRIVMNFYTAKRMVVALQMSIQRYEAAFGVIEIDVEKRRSTK